MPRIASGRDWATAEPGICEAGRSPARRPIVVSEATGAQRPNTVPGGTTVPRICAGSSKASLTGYARLCR